jgi:hypothetical protein
MMSRLLPVQLLLYALQLGRLVELIAAKKADDEFVLQVRHSPYTEQY